MTLCLCVNLGGRETKLNSDLSDIVRYYDMEDDDFEYVLKMIEQIKGELAGDQ